MAKLRSPNYPAVGLDDAVQAARAIWDKEKRTAVPAEVIAKAWGYSSLSGQPRTKIGALRKYGLLEERNGKLALSELGIRAVHHPAGSAEHLEAIQEAALRPDIFRELATTHLDASDTALRSHLVVDRRFSDAGAAQVIKAFRDTMETASVQAVPRDEQVPAESTREVRALPSGASGGSASSTLPRTRVWSFSWPLARDVTAEVRITGEQLTAAHLERLAQYLKLATDALEDGDGDGE